MRTLLFHPTLLILSSAILACGDDSGATDGGTRDAPAARFDSGGDEDDGGGGSDDGGAAEDDGGGVVVDGGTAADGGPITGCADGVACPEGLMCCMGRPYPPEGLCQEMCTMRSDRAAKDAFELVDESAILERVAALPITEWSYRDETGVRHVGPMAQDFREAFGLGGDDRTIHPVDANGVALAAIQALHDRVRALEAEHDALRRDNEALRRRCD